MDGDCVTIQLFITAAHGHYLPPLCLCPSLASTDCLQTHPHTILTPWKLELHLVMQPRSRPHRKQPLQQFMRYDSCEVTSDFCCTASPLFVGSAKALPWQWIKIISRTGNCTNYKWSQFYAQLKSIKIVIRSRWLRYFRSSFGSHQPGFSKRNCHPIMSPLIANPAMQIAFQDRYRGHSVTPTLHT